MVLFLKRINKSRAILKSKCIEYTGIFNFSRMAEGANLESDYLDPNPGLATSDLRKCWTKCVVSFCFPICRMKAKTWHRSFTEIKINHLCQIQSSFCHSIVLAIMLFFFF